MQIKQINIRNSTEEFVEKYWSLGFELDLNKSFEELEREHKEYLRKKYGKDVINRYVRLSDNWHKHNGSKKYYDAINSFVMETGLVEDVGLITPSRSKATLPSLLDFLSNEENTSPEFTLTDLGCGDGKIAIGLALYIDNLKRIYAIDYNKKALKRLEKNIRNLSAREQTIVTEKIIPIEANYESKETKSKFDNEIRGTDFVLAAYTFRGFAEVLPHVKSFMKPQTGKILRYNQYEMNPPNLNWALESIVEDKNEMAAPFGLKFSSLSCSAIFPSEYYAIGVLGEFSDNSAE